MTIARKNRIVGYCLLRATMKCIRMQPDLFSNYCRGILFFCLLEAARNIKPFGNVLQVLECVLRLWCIRSSRKFAVEYWGPVWWISVGWISFFVREMGIVVISQTFYNSQLVIFLYSLTILDELKSHQDLRWIAWMHTLSHRNFEMSLSQFSM